MCFDDKTIPTYLQARACCTKYKYLFVLLALVLKYLVTYKYYKKQIQDTFILNVESGLWIIATALVQNARPQQKNQKTLDSFMAPYFLWDSGGSK